MSFLHHHFFGDIGSLAKIMSKREVLVVFLHEFTREVAKELYVDHAAAAPNLKKNGKKRDSVSGCCTG